MKFSTIKKNSYYIFLAIIIFLGLVLRLKGLLTNMSFWHDECALGYNVLNKSYGELFGKLRFLQVAPPMFLIVSKFLVNIFQVKNNFFWCDFVLRLFPFFCNVGAIYVFYLVSKKLFNHKFAILFAMTLISFNPVLINYSFEFKPYSTDVLCTLLSVLIFLSIDFKKDSLKKIYIYGTTLAILIWFSFISGLVMAAGFLVLSFKKDNPKLYTSLLMPVVISVFFYFKYFIFASYGQNSESMVGFWQEKFVNKDFSNVAYLISENLKYFFSGVYLSQFFIIFSMFIGVSLFISDNKWRFVNLSVLTLSLLIIASMLHYYPFSKRLIIFMIPFVLLYIAKSADLKNKIISFILISIILLPHLFLAINFMKIKNFNKGDFARECMAHIAQSVKKDDKIFVNGASNVEYFYYNSFFKIPNEMVYKDINQISKGNYWLYMPYDYKSQAKEIKKIVSWAEKNTKILYRIQASLSHLLYVVAK